MNTLEEVIEAYGTFDIGLKEAKLHANQVLDRLHFQIWRNSYPPDYSMMVWQNSLFELGYLYGRAYQDVPDAFKRAFKWITDNIQYMVLS